MAEGIKRSTIMMILVLALAISLAVSLAILDSSSEQPTAAVVKVSNPGAQPDEAGYLDRLDNDYIEEEEND